jgi:asparagine synthase (glutamine-hydrolysing)
MCGIFCKTAYYSPPLSSEKMDKVLRLLEHRGPDNQTVWSNPSDNLQMAHLRLSINDLSEAGNQPMISPDKRYASICNGEVYNYQVLRDELEEAGYSFHSNSDSEVILHGFACWGRELPTKLQGMFAFAVWDNEEEILFAARDHVGMKPLYYTRSDQDVVISSEATPLAALQQNPELDRRALAYVLTVGYIPAPHAVWAGVSSLPAGHILEWTKDGALDVSAYWTPHTERNSIAVDDLQQQFEDLFEDVVEEHMMSDVPVALFLSGGIDSSALAVALARRKQNVEAITLNYPDAPRQEVEAARAVCKTLGLKHRVVDLEKTAIEQLAKKTAAAFDQPQGYSALMSMLQISDVAAQDYKVVLGGDGGDEVFSGYSWYNTPYRSFGVVAKILRALTKPIQIRSRVFAKIKHKVFAWQSVRHHHASKLFPRFLPEEVETLLSLKSAGGFGDGDMLVERDLWGRSSKKSTLDFQKLDLMSFCSGSILPKVDRASMCYALEVRAPFLDKRLIEWSFGLQDKEQDALRNKSLVKSYLSKHLPAEVLNLPKQGFSVPLDKMITVEDMEAVIDGSALVQDRYISTRWRESISPHYHLAKCWILYFLCLWYEDKKVKVRS